MAANDLDICNQSLNLLGQPPIASFTEGTANSNTCAQTFPDFNKMCLTIYPWKFAMDIRQLALIANVDPIGFTYAFQLPSDRLSAPEAIYISTDGNLTKHFQILRDRLNVDFAEIWIKYALDVPVNEWEPIFTRFVVTAYAADICMAVTERNGLAGRLESGAWGDIRKRNGGLYKAATRLDSRRSSPRSMVEDGGPLIRARQSGSGNRIISGFS